ncbi:MAG: helix-turn-helix domain-containing protein [Candidatus Omnitrophota bacterium]|nr:helix-turn-helix domain-containing protein [Candidatus Omnitrophota bacterium]
MEINDFFVTVKHGEIYHAVIGDLEKSLIERALEYASGNQITAAKLLGINRNTIRAKIKKLNISVDRFKS